MVVLARELTSADCTLSPDEFRDTVQELKAIMYPAWSDEELTYHPEEAILFCNAVRKKSRCLALKNNLILRTLANSRKRRAVEA